MKLPIPFLKKKEASNHFLALLIRDEKASAVIFKEETGRISVVGKHEEYFPTSVEHATPDEILDTLDKTISIAEDTLPANMETEKTIFGLKETWVEDGKIKKDYLAKLKKVSDELKLSPVGFLVISEAISKLIEEEEGAPLSAIITEVGKNNVTLTLFKAGRNIESHSSHIEESTPKTVDALLKTFESVEVLPSRLIIFDGEQGETIAQQFISHQWSRGLPFLHMPQVSVVPAGFDGRSVVFGAAIQMGFQVAGSIVEDAASDIKTLSVGEAEANERPTRRSKEMEEVESKDVDEETSNGEHEATSVADNFGFVVGKDIAIKEIVDANSSVETELENEPVIEKQSDPDLKNEESMQYTQERESNFQRVDENFTPDEEEQVESEKSESKPNPLLSKLTSVFGVVKLIRLPGKIAFSGIRGGSKMLLIPPIIILLLVGAVLLYIFKLEAKVTLNVQPKTQEESESITFSATDENDFENSIIQAQAVSTTIEGDISIDTTGEKEIGEKAKGTVTIFNNSEAKRTLSAGTTITSSNNLDFVLDKEVSVASGSGSVFTGTKPGTAQVAVTAKNIGNEYNLPSNAEFKIIGGASGVAAKNESAFSGGSKKEVRVVAKKDIDKINDSLPKSLAAQAKTELAKEIPADETLLSDFTDMTLSKKTYNKKEGEEAKTLTLKASVTFEGLTYSNKDVTEYARTLLKDKVSENQNLSDDALTFEVLDIEEVSDDEMKAKLAIEAGILPKLDDKKIIDALKGKSFEDAKNYLSGLPQVKDADIILSPNIPLLPKILPRIGDNIKVVINTNG